MEEKKEKVMRRDLSGIYIFDTLEGDERRKPTCIEDCTEKKRWEWIYGLETEAILRTIEMLYNDIIKILANRNLILYSDDPKEDKAERRKIIQHFRDNKMRDINPNKYSSKYYAAYTCNAIAEKLRQIGDMLDIARGKGEDDEQA